MLLLVSLPRNRAAGTHDEGAAHAPDFKEW
jgi:hypothetical protein